MFFQYKKKKIEQYLQAKAPAYTAFDELLMDYLNGNIKERMIQFGIKNSQYHIDWLENYKCIDIQGKYHGYYVNVQIEENELSIACDQVEPDDPQEYALETKAQVYSVLENTLKNLT